MCDRRQESDLAYPSRLFAHGCPHNQVSGHDDVNPRRSSAPHPTSFWLILLPLTRDIPNWRSLVTVLLGMELRALYHNLIPVAIYTCSMIDNEKKFENEYRVLVETLQDIDDLPVSVG